jgi:hypothetical protein
MKQLTWMIFAGLPITTILLSCVLACSGQPARAQEQFYYVANTSPPDAFLALRTEPSAITGQRIAKLPNGTKLKLLERREDAWWFVRVIQSGEQGWVLSGQNGTIWVECCIRLTQAPFIAPRAAHNPPPDFRAPADAILQQRRVQEQSQQNARRRYQESIEKQDRDRENQNQQDAMRKSLEAQLDAIPIAPDNEPRIRELCRSAAASRELSSADRASVAMKCQNNLQVLQYRKEAVEEKAAAQRSREKLQDLVAQIERVPTTKESAEELNRLLRNNNYRLSILTFPDQNRYYQAITKKLGDLRDAYADLACEGIVKKLHVPEVLRRSIVLDGLAGVSLTRFLCGAIVANSNVSISLDAQSFQVRINGAVLNFNVVRYLPEQRTAVPDNSPVQGGTPALALASVTDRDREVSIGNPNYFIINLYAQWTPQLSAFVAQQHR